jgi:hypothetical protein
MASSGGFHFSKNQLFANNSGTAKPGYSGDFTGTVTQPTLSAMKPEILMVSRSEGCREMFSVLARNESLATRTCEDAFVALDMVAGLGYAGVVQDLDLPGAESVLRLAHMLPAEKRPVVMALVSARQHVASAYELGVNFVLYKPLREEQVQRTLRASRGFMRAERRRAQRRPMRHLLHFDLPGEVCCPALLLDVSESGMAIQTIGAFPQTADLPFRLELPRGIKIRGLAEPVWTDSRGRAGLAFAQLSLRDQHSLESWLRSREEQNASREPQLAELALRT